MSLVVSDIIERSWKSSDLRKPIDWLRFEQDIRDVLSRFSAEFKSDLVLDGPNLVLALGAIDQVLAAHTRRGGSLRI